MEKENENNEFYSKKDVMSMLGINESELVDATTKILEKYEIDVKPYFLHNIYVYTKENFNYLSDFVKNDGCIPSLSKTKPYVDYVRREAKKKVGKKFIVGEKYYIKNKNGNKVTYKIYELKKYIYSIGEISVCCLIMKQIGGEPVTTKFTLNKFDCIKYHIKYEDGLEVFPMNLNFIKISENTNFFNKLMSKQY